MTVCDAHARSVSAHAHAHAATLGKANGPDPRAYLRAVHTGSVAQRTCQQRRCRRCWQSHPAGNGVQRHRHRGRMRQGSVSWDAAAGTARLAFHSRDRRRDDMVGDPGVFFTTADAFLLATHRPLWCATLAHHSRWEEGLR